LPVLPSQGFDPAHGLGHRHAGDLVDVFTGHRHRQGLRPQPRPAARRARPLAHPSLHPRPEVVRRALLVAAAQVGDHSLEGRLVDPPASVPGLVANGDPHVLPGPVEEQMQLLGGEGAHRDVGGDAEGPACGLQQLPVVAAFLRPAPGYDSPLGQGEVLVRDQQVGVQLQLHPQALAGRAGALGAVEGEQAGLQLGQADAAVGAGEVLAEQQILRRLRRGVVHDHQAVPQPQGRLHRVLQAGSDPPRPGARPGGPPPPRCDGSCSDPARWAHPDPGWLHPRGRGQNPCGGALRRRDRDGPCGPAPRGPGS